MILFPLTSVEAEKMFSQLKIVETKLRFQMSHDFLNAVRHNSNSFDEIKRIAVDTWRNAKANGHFK